MNCSLSTPFTLLLAAVLAFAAGCGGSDEAPPSQDDGSSTALPQPAVGQPNPGEPQVNSPETDGYPRVEFQTTAGNFTVTLRRDLVPRTVDNFLGYVEQGFYDGTIFHAVTPNYAIEGGGYIQEDGKILEKPGLEGIRSEAANGLPNQRGTIAMTREEESVDSARCQFFFNLADNKSLDYVPEEPGVPLWQTEGYCAFGTVEGNGLKVLDDIANQPVTSRSGMDRVPVEPTKVISVRKL